MTIILPKYTGPGPTELIGYYEDPNNPTRQHGFFGEVSSSEFISGDVLASTIGLTAGTSQNSTTPWLKFYVDGKIVYVPKKTLRRNVSWEDIYQAGAVYGDDSTGLNPAGTLVVQDTQVTIGQDTFKVMLIRGANSDPAADKYGYDRPTTHGSEWNRLFYNIGIADVSGGKKASQEGGQWANYTDAELDMNFFSNSGKYSWCMEQHKYGATYRILRGHTGVSYLSTANITDNHDLHGWRPKLELNL